MIFPPFKITDETFKLYLVRGVHAFFNTPVIRPQTKYLDGFGARGLGKMKTRFYDPRIVKYELGVFWEEIMKF
jgi:hypothetical protein